MDETNLLQSATVAMRPATTSAGPISATPDEGRFIPGTLVAGRYRIISLLGAGGMGEVYRATDLTLAQPVALKFLSASGSTSLRMLELFHNEVRVARQVSHPNVCRVYDVGEADGMPYISMEYVDGEDLAALLTRIGRLPADKALEIARKICAGVAAAHDKGVIHRDLKPANIMLDRRGNVVIMDFGLAAVADQLKGAEARSGTPAYMAPEQLRGESATAKSDIYALGLVLYEVFTGRRVYEAGTLAELLRLQESGQITSMSAIAAEIDPAVEKAIRRCLESDPARRPDSALAVSAALPGGDPLAAALAAGETPSPELVAASGATEGLPLGKSVPLALGLAGLIIAIPFLRINVELHSLTPYEMSVDALAQKVREHASALGYTSIPADRKYDLHWSVPIIENYRKRAKTVDEMRKLFVAESPVELAYRESPLPLNVPNGEVTETRPAPIISGMIEAWLNSRGELREFKAVPPQTDAAEPRDLDPLLIARSTGLNLGEWQETSPPYTPLYAFDRIKAWTGKHPGLDVPVTLQASSWHGKLTELYTVWPWSKPGRMPAQNIRNARQSARTMIYNVTSAIMFVFSAFLAIRNLRVGRGDLRGATRLAAAYALLSCITWVCTTHWIPDTAMFSIFATAASEWITSAGLVWLLYVALEPVVRARWPQSLITWTRLLGGKWRDPLVGAHVLYGALLGVVITFFFIGSQFYDAAYGEVGAATDSNVGTTTRHFIATITGRLKGASEMGLIAIFVIFFFRRLLRKDWAASIAGSVLFALEEGDVWQSGRFLDFAFFVLIFALLIFVMLRLGLVSMTLAVFFVNMLLQTPGAQTLTKPYEWAVILYPLLALAIVAWAFWQTSGERLLTAEEEADA